jgi:glutaredoxin
VLYSRAGCHLCDDLHRALAALPAARGVAVEVRDVDADAAARVRWGHKVPVLLYAGELVCHGHLDADEVHKTLKLHRRPV